MNSFCGWFDHIKFGLLKFIANFVYIRTANQKMLNCHPAGESLSWPSFVLVSEGIYVQTQKSTSLKTLLIRLFHSVDFVKRLYIYIFKSFRYLYSFSCTTNFWFLLIFFLLVTFWSFVIALIYGRNRLATVESIVVIQVSERTSTIFSVKIHRQLNL